MNKIVPFRRPGATIGVVIVTYDSEQVIGGCLDSLFASLWPDLRVVASDNDSADGTLRAMREVAARHSVPVTSHPTLPGTGHTLTILENGRNLGFAAAVNLGLDRLRAYAGIDLFWILNPDCMVLPDTAAAYLRRAHRQGAFSLMGGRTLYHAPCATIQSDGGRIGRWSGVCRNANQGSDPGRAGAPSAATLDYISGANLVASRAFLERAGPMPEDYFLYYEEVDWAQRRGDLPLATCPEAVVLHHGGTSIGSGIPGRLPSALSNYFNYRNRMRFLRRYRRHALPSAWCHGMLKIAQLCRHGAWGSAAAAFRGLNGLAPPAAVRDRLAPETHRRAFGSRPVDATRPALTD